MIKTYENSFKTENKITVSWVELKLSLSKGTEMIWDLGPVYIAIVELYIEEFKLAIYKGKWKKISHIEG